MTNRPRNVKILTMNIINGQKPALFDERIRHVDASLRHVSRLSSLMADCSIFGALFDKMVKSAQSIADNYERRTRHSLHKHGSAGQGGVAGGKPPRYYAMAANLFYVE